MVEAPTTLPKTRQRRSQRIPLAVRLKMKSLDPKVAFNEVCETMVVNSHGCGLRTTKPVEKGTPVELELVHNKVKTTAHVVMCSPLTPDKKSWELGIELDRPENYWGIQFPPEDWQETAKASRLAADAAPAPAAPAPTAVAAPPAPPQPEPPPVAAASPPPAPTVSAPPVQAAAPGPAPAAKPAAPPPAPPVTAAPQPAAAPVTAAPPPTPPKLAPMPATPSAAAVETIARTVEQELRARAQKISTEFEEQYRQSLGNLFVRLRADLEERARKDWDWWGQETKKEVGDLARQATEQVEQALARGRDFHTATEAQVEEARKLRDYVESVARLVPQTVEQRLQEGLNAVLPRVQARLDEDFSARQAAHLDQLERTLGSLAEKIGADLRQKLLEDSEHNERELLDRVGVHLEEVRAAGAGVREYAQKATHELTHLSEKTLLAAEKRMEELFAHREQQMNARFDQRVQQMQQAASSALRQLGEQAWNSLQQQMRAEFDTRQEKLSQTLRTAQTEAARLESRADELTLRLGPGLDARLDQVVADASARARNEMDRASTQARETHLARLQEDFDRTLQPKLAGAEVALNEVQGAVGSLRADSATLKEQAADLRRELRQTEVTITEKRREFEQFVASTLAETSGEIRGRVRQAVEMAQEPLAHRAQEIRAELERLGESRRADLTEIAQESLDRLDEARTSAEAAVASALETRTREALERFQESADKLVQDSSRRLQSSLDDAFADVTRILREKLGPRS
jgi:hypothetical protein